jgi:Protein of unknown function (DUF3293)
MGNQMHNVAFALRNDRQFSLRVGGRSAALDQLLTSHRTQTAVFITASNPYSRTTSERENAEANSRLQTDLIKVSIAVLDGYGQGDDGEWPAEQSFLAIGITRNDAEALGRRYKQNAMVWIGSSFVPELVMLAGSGFAQE